MQPLTLAAFKRVLNLPESEKIEFKKALLPIISFFEVLTNEVENNNLTSVGDSIPIGLSKRTLQIIEGYYCYDFGNEIHQAAFENSLQIEIHLIKKDPSGLDKLGVFVRHKKVPTPGSSKPESSAQMFEFTKGAFGFSSMKEMVSVFNEQGYWDGFKESRSFGLGIGENPIPL